MLDNVSTVFPDLDIIIKSILLSFCLLLILCNSSIDSMFISRIFFSIAKVISKKIFNYLLERKRNG